MNPKNPFFRCLCFLFSVFLPVNAYLLGLNKISSGPKAKNVLGSHHHQIREYTFPKTNTILSKPSLFGPSERNKRYPTVTFYDWNSEFDDEDSFDEEGDPSFDSDEDSSFSFGKKEKTTSSVPSSPSTKRDFQKESPNIPTGSVSNIPSELNAQKNRRWGGLFRRRSVNLNMSDQPNQNGEAKFFIPEEFKYEARNYSLDMKGNALFSYWTQGILIVTAGVVLVFTSSLNQSNLIASNASLIRKKVSNPTYAYLWNGTLSAALAVVMGIFSFFQTIGYSVLSRRILKVIDQNPNPSKPQTFSLLKKLNAKESPAKFIVRKTSSALMRGTIINIIGLFFALISAEQFVGSLIGKVLSSQGIQQLYGGGVGVPQTVQPTDIFVIQANTNTLFSHFISLVLTLRLLQRTGRMKQYLIN